MKRKIIKIDEDLCNGCGDCVSSCAEGALKIVNGKAKLVRENFCDGFGSCLKECPTGALTLEEREAPPFDEAPKLKNPSHHEASHQHEGCPGAKTMVLQQKNAKPVVISNTQTGFQAIPSELAQWPVHLRLVSPNAACFKNKELVVLSTCSPIASADVHWRYLRGRSVVVACPKLDDTSSYIGKLREIAKEPTIPRIIVLRMTVPCCAGLAQMVSAAAKSCGRTDLLEVEEHILGLDGTLQQINKI